MDSNSPSPPRRGNEAGYFSIGASIAVDLSPESATNWDKVCSLKRCGAVRWARVPVGHLLYFELPSDGPFGPEATSVYSELAGDISHEEGLIWKVWTENAERGRAGGVYLFTDEALADQDVVKHSARLGPFGITGIEYRSIGVQDALSEITRANLS